MDLLSPPPWSFQQGLTAYLAALLVMGLLDGLWLGWLAKSFYSREMGALMAEAPRRVPAAVFYLVYPLGIVCFGLSPMPVDWLTAFVRCAALGLLAYGTYDLTNLAVMRGFSARLGLVDMAWGSLATAIAGTVAWVAVGWWSMRGG